MWRPPAAAHATIALVAWVALCGCSFEGERPGAQGPCADPAGVLLGCDGEVATPEAACRKLVECGVIDFDRESSPADYSGCVRQIERMSRHQRDFAIACVEHATCDDLERTETCFDHGGG